VSFGIEDWEKRWNERPTVVTIHGWRNYFNVRRGNILIPDNTKMISDQFKAIYDVNVVRVSWKNGFWYGYEGAAKAVEGIGRKVAAWLNSEVGNADVIWRNMTIIGHSLGGRID
jgi:hypothetical protein